MQLCLNHQDLGSNTSSRLTIPHFPIAIYYDSPTHFGRKEIEDMITSFPEWGNWDSEMLSDPAKVSPGNQGVSWDLEGSVDNWALSLYPLLIYESWMPLEKPQGTAEKTVMIWFKRTLHFGGVKKVCIYLYSKSAEYIVIVPDIIRQQQ